MASGLTGILGTLTLRSCDMFGNGVVGFLGFSAASDDIEGLADGLDTSDAISELNGTIQTNIRIAAPTAAAGIQKLARLRESETLARIRIARFGGAETAL